jgi:hypothetical protein
VDGFFQDVCGNRQTPPDEVPKVEPLKPEQSLAKVNFGKPQDALAG